MAAVKEANIWDELRKPFPTEVVGVLPKVNCHGCSQAIKTARTALDKHCGRHPMERCKVCSAWITTGHIHLDYVGHAAVTDRLNNVAGPEGWTWEPLATDEHGLPLLDDHGNLWIRLTVRGVSRIGYGDGSASIKELIGDAIRNAAMRFGIALDLWSKDELESTLEEPSLKNEKPAAEATAVQKGRIKGLLIARGIGHDEMQGYLAQNFDVKAGETMTGAQAAKIIEALEADRQAAAGELEKAGLR